MAVSFTPVFPQAPTLGLASLTNNASSSANQVICYTGNTNGTKVVSIMATSTDTINRAVRLVLTRSATNYDLATVAIPPASGTDASQANATVDLMKLSQLPGLPLDSEGQHYLFLKTSDVLSAYSSANAITNATKIDIFVIASDF